jgi:hypothetical protein
MLNWWHDSIPDTLAFNQVALKDLYPDDRYEVKAGVNAQFGQGWSAWGNLGYQWGDQIIMTRRCDWAPSTHGSLELGAWPRRRPGPPRRTAAFRDRRPRPD